MRVKAASCLKDIQENYVHLVLRVHACTHARGSKYMHINKRLMSHSVTCLWEQLRAAVCVTEVYFVSENIKDSSSWHTQGACVYVGAWVKIRLLDAHAVQYFGAHGSEHL